MINTIHKACVDQSFRKRLSLRSDFTQVDLKTVGRRFSQSAPQCQCEWILRRYVRRVLRRLGITFLRIGVAMSETLTKPRAASNARSVSSSRRRHSSSMPPTIRIDQAHLPASAPPEPAEGKRSPGGQKKTTSARIQLRLSRNLVAILKAFARAGQRPSKLVERSLWADPQMRDAALLLGVEVPEQITARKLNRIKPKVSAE